MRGICVSVASILCGLCATAGDGAWKLRITYVQHTCTARNGHMNSVVNARELRARCDGTWTYKNESFFRISGNNLSVLGNENDFQILRFPLSIYCFRKLFADTCIRNYFLMSVNISLNHEILDKCPFTSMAPLYWHGLTLFPAWISNHVPGKMWDEIAYTFLNSESVKRHRWDSEMDK